MNRRINPMNRTLGSIILAGSLTLGLGAYGVANLTKVASASATPLTAVSQLMNTANLNATNSPLAPPDHGGRQGAPGVFGKVTAVNRATLTVEDARQQSSTTVALNSSTTIS